MPEAVLVAVFLTPLAPAALSFFVDVQAPVANFVQIFEVDILFANLSGSYHLLRQRFAFLTLYVLPGEFLRLPHLACVCAATRQHQQQAKQR
jgi:hypothetical protein